MGTACLGDVVKSSGLAVSKSQLDVFSKRHAVLQPEIMMLMQESLGKRLTCAVQEVRSMLEKTFRNFGLWKEHSDHCLPSPP